VKLDSDEIFILHRPGLSQEFFFFFFRRESMEIILFFPFFFFLFFRKKNVYLSLATWSYVNDDIDQGHMI